MISTKIPPSPFPKPFTKALSLAVTYKGQVTSGSFNLTPAGEVPVETATANVGSAGVDFLIGTTANDQRGLLQVTADGWLKAWPGSKTIILGKSEPYPQGQLKFPGGYDPNKYAVPLEKGRILKDAGTLNLTMASASYQGANIEECGSTMQYTLDAGIPVLFLVLWLETDQSGKIEFPIWPGSSTGKTIKI